MSNRGERKNENKLEIPTYVIPDIKSNLIFSNHNVLSSIILDSIQFNIKNKVDWYDAEWISFFSTGPITTNPSIDQWRYRDKVLVSSSYEKLGKHFGRR